MNRIILILLLIGIGIYIYYYIIKPGYYNTFTNTKPKKININNSENNSNKNNRHVHFAKDDIILGINDHKKSDNVETYNPIINKSFNQDTNINNPDTYFDDIFIKPIEISNTNLTLSENEYFNN